MAITNAFGGTPSIAALLTVTNDFDLQLLGVTGPPQAVSGQSMKVSWSVTNQGGASFNGTFHDQVFLSPNSAGSNATLSAVFNFSGSILAGQAVSLSGFITPDINLSGNQWVVIKTDANAQVPGGNGETNFTAISASPVSILLQPLAGLADGVCQCAAFSLCRPAGDHRLGGDQCRHWRHEHHSLERWCVALDRWID